MGHVSEVSAAVYEAAGRAECVGVGPENWWEGLSLVEEWIGLFDH